MTSASAAPSQPVQPAPGASPIPASSLDAWFQQGLALHRRGQIEDAKALYEQILAADPRHADALHLLGVIAAQSNDPALSEALISQAIAINPNKAAFYTNLGLALKALHRLDEANDNFDKAITRHPASPEAQYNKGLVLRDLHQPAGAIACFDKAIELKPDYAEAFFDRGNALRDLLRKEDAVASYDQAIRIKPDYLEAIFNRGISLQEHQRIEEAISSYDLLISYKPDLAEALFRRGTALLALKRTEEAIASFDKAIAIDPNFAQAFSNRGFALQEINRTQDALVSFEQASAIQPDLTEPHINLGWLLFKLRRFSEAIASFDKALAIQPDYANASFNKALALLITGQYAQGWALYEWRWKTKNLIPYIHNYPFPLWLGKDSLAGKSILLHAEQGFGDCIQFVRYARMVKSLGAHVTLEVPQPLLSLFRRLPGVDVLIETGSPLPAYDYHCPLMSLPLAFGTTLTSIPAATGYLTADADKARDWRERLGPKTKHRIGLVWNGGHRPNQPELWTVNDRRNVDLQLFASALRHIPADFYSLQKGDPAESQIRGHELDYWPNGNFHNHAHALNDYADTAALIENLDLVISVDTSTAHLAAALGKPTWILSRYDSCWRWLLDRNDSPWYATVKLYRQDESQRWEPVLQRLAQDLKV